MRTTVLALGLTLLVLGCHAAEGEHEESGHGETTATYFPTGDPDAGFEVYERMGCSTCHLLARSAEGAPVSPRPSVLTLPRPGVKPRSDTELFTAIVDPGHQLDPQFVASVREAGSPMPTYRDVMTVQQLLDVIAYLKDAESSR